MTKTELRNALVILKKASKSISRYAESIDLDTDEGDWEFEHYSDYTERIERAVEDIEDVIYNLNKASLEY